MITLEQAERLLAFVKSLAASELCRDSDKREECQLDSGPYCGTHTYFNEQDVEEARELLKEIGLDSTGFSLWKDGPKVNV